MDASGFFIYPTEDAPSAPSLEFLPEATEDEWAKLLAYTEMQLFDAGDTVIAEGEPGRALYLLTEGTLELTSARHRGAPRVLAATTVLGELSFFDGRPRSATLRALTGGEILRLGREAFESLCAREPRLGQAVLFELGRVLSLRFRDAEHLGGRTG